MFVQVFFQPVLSFSHFTPTLTRWQRHGKELWVVSRHLKSPVGSGRSIRSSRSPFPQTTQKKTTAKWFCQSLPLPFLGRLLTLPLFPFLILVWLPCFFHALLMSRAKTTQRQIKCSDPVFFLCFAHERKPSNACVSVKHWPVEPKEIQSNKRVWRRRSKLHEDPFHFPIRVKR